MQIIGDYDYKALCMPTIPWSKVPVLEKDEPLPLMLSLVMGLQHAFAMVGGLITPPYVVFQFSVGAAFPDVSGVDPSYSQYAISAALITSGICTIINIFQVPIPMTEGIFGRKLYIGSGVLSVMGTSFTFLPIFEIAIRQMKDDGVAAFGRLREDVGYLHGLWSIGALLSVMPVNMIKKIFPPLVSGISVMLIGAALTGTGMKYWGGGVVCAEAGFPCAAGDVSLPYGSPELIGLGFSVLCFLVVIELFGSTFMKNCNVILALLFGYFVAGVSDYQGDSYVNNDRIEDAESITFLWAETFPIGFYGPAVFPLLIAYLVTTVETVGDLGATYEASDLDTNDPEFNETIQGGLMADSICSILASLFTSMPNTTFSQNNGVISMTKCASRRAGYACGFWLILMGILGKISGIITSIPDCVLGGMTIFLFSSVFTSGIRLLGSEDLSSRRVRFIVAMSMAVGIGVTIWPYAFADKRNQPYTAAFWPCDDCSDGEKGIRNGISIFLSTGYCIGTVIAILLNLILPADVIVLKASEKAEKEVEEDDEPSAEAMDESGAGVEEAEKEA
eukprot:CAMPEP_0116010320 /NCGR_PEP_ID=MMETSP0321-20121206/3936_1 /TAXON_ID=163516 /ORGANISM="Leptocylindrus danicus var. danicus, Strain B650" /LENGTH=560 /DNA_ID=CAMNT_0003479407 /DNA_START=64 /DNA_END=1746 /DNA_ORIENTATION=+